MKTKYRKASSVKSHNDPLVNEKLFTFLTGRIKSLAKYLEQRKANLVPKRAATKKGEV